MRPSIAFVAILALAGCSASPDREAAARTALSRSGEHRGTPSATRSPASEKALESWPGYPDKQPDGSPLSAAYCLRVGDQSGSPFDNIKTCLQIACDRSDKASCDLAESYNGNLRPEEAGSGGDVTDTEAKAVLSPAFRTCFGPDAPLDAESYDCVDTEYRRLDALLTMEYRAALARQQSELTRNRLLSDERNWWRTRFDYCRGEVGDLRGSTATVVNEFLRDRRPRQTRRHAATPLTRPPTRSQIGRKPRIAVNFGPPPPLR